jgi:isocitrate dehydrogenase kinase/phosphatase
VAELKQFAPSLVEEEGDQIIIKHLYIERRMVPLNIWLTEKENDEAQLEHGMLEYGNAIKELVAANIFPGDMLYKNFGVTRHQRGVLRLRRNRIHHRLQVPRDARAAQRRRRNGLGAVVPDRQTRRLPRAVWQLPAGESAIRKYFLKHHADLLTPEYWQARKQRIEQGLVEDVFPYPQHIRFFTRSYQHSGGDPATFMET